MNHIEVLLDAAAVQSHSAAQLNPPPHIRPQNLTACSSRQSCVLPYFSLTVEPFLYVASLLVFLPRSVDVGLETHPFSEVVWLTGSQFVLSVLQTYYTYVYFHIVSRFLTAVQPQKMQFNCRCDGVWNTIL